MGESVYVAGEATTDDPALGGYGGPDAVIRGRADRSLGDRLFGFPFVVGDGGEKAVRRHFRRRGLIFAAAGLVLAGGVTAVAVLAV